MRRWVLPAAVAVSIPLAVPTLLRAISVTDWWWLTIAFVGAAIAGVPAALLLDKVKRRHERREEASLKLLAGAVGGGQWLVRDIPGPHVVGTGSADNHPDGPPPYIQRDQHQFVADRLVPGAFVLVVGDVTAGKTRLAYEAVRQKLPDYLLIAPERREFLTAAIESAARGRCVLWLDDLERFLGTDGLTASAITRMRRGTIVATLRRENLRHLHDAESFRVLAFAEEIPVERRNTMDELCRAAACCSDPRIEDAVEHSEEYGVAEYLAAAPALYAAWQHAQAPGEQPRAAAMVETAIALRLAGFAEPLPKRLINELHRHYLNQRGGLRLRPETIDEAWDWASMPHHANTALLERIDDDHVSVAPHLVDRARREASDGRVSMAVTRIMEGTARRIIYVYTAIPELVQTHEYAEMYFDIEGNCQFTTVAEARRQYSECLEHQDILDRPHPPKVVLVLSEAAVREGWGDAKIMTDQIEYLLELADRPGVDLRMVPYGHRPYPIFHYGCYEILEFEDAFPVAQFPAAHTDLFSYDLGTVEGYLKSYELHAQHALDPNRSKLFLTEILAEYQTEHDASLPGRRGVPIH